MNQIIFSPQWFFNYDIVFDLLSAMVVLIIAFYANKLAKYDKSKRYRYFSLSFFLVGMAFIAKSLTNFVIYHPVEIMRAFGGEKIIYSAYVVSNTPFVLGFFAFRLFYLLGFLGIYLILTKYREIFYIKGGKHFFVILIYFIIITTLFSWSSYYVFHLTTMMLTYPIYCGYRDMFSKNKKRNTNVTAWAFLVILASQFMFLFVTISKIFYFLGETFQLVGYLMLAYVFYKVVKS